MVCYVITLSKVFSTKHQRRGAPTHFRERFLRKRKIHTIRGNYSFWFKRFVKLDKGIAYVSIREWIGKPYKSKQKHIKSIHNPSLQKIIYLDGEYYVDTKKIDIVTLAHNDGLSVEDFKEWFKGTPNYSTLALIHFTNFRY